MKAGETMTTPIEGVVVTLNKIVRDQRGFLAELMPGGLANPTAHGEFGNLYLSVAETKFVARGGHYHKTENSIESFYCIGGTVVWILYDYRKESPTQGTLVDIVVGKPLDASASPLCPGCTIVLCHCLTSRRKLLGFIQSRITKRIISELRWGMCRELVTWQNGMGSTCKL